MSEIKQVQMSMPVLTKTGRKSRKGVKKGLEETPVQQQQGIVGVAPGAVAAVAQVAGAAVAQVAGAVAGGAGAGAVTRKQPLVLQQKKQLLQPQQGGVSSTTAVNVPVIMINAKAPAVPVQPLQPVPALSTTSVVGGKKKEAPSDKQKKIVLAKKAITLKAPPVKTPTLQIQPKTRNNKTLKKSYSAKRITIHIENPKNVRKTRDAVRRNIANMTLEEITEKLRQRGLVRPEACPPEHIQRLMMVDIELFPAPM